ncbi:MAG: hypothetical protein FWD74_07445, partial [Actinomycetia bacterium]|nr:hypothetical protein [Actinomycetes bacterium]
LPTGWSWDDQTLSVGPVGDQAHPATFDPDTANYNVLHGVPVTVTVTALPLASALVTLAPGPYVYTGAEVTPVVTSVTVGAVTVPSADYTVSYDFNIEAGTATVTVTASAGSTNFTGSATGAFTIDKADPDHTPPAVSATYGQTLADLTLPPGWSWDDSTELVGPAGPQTHTATITPTDTDNYNTLTGIDVTVTVAPKALTVIAADKSKLFGAADPPLTWSAAGLLAGDTLTGSLKYTGTAVGDYDIVQNVPFASSDYSITFVKGTMTIKPTAAMTSAADKINALPYPVQDQADADQVASATKAFNALSPAQQAQLPATVRGTLKTAQTEAGPVNHAASNVTVAGKLPWNIRLVVTEIDSSDPSYAAFAAAAGGQQPLALYDIKLVNTLTGKAYEPPVGTSLTVTLGGLSLTADQSVAVVHQKASGALEQLSAKAFGDTVTFKATSFSRYGVFEGQAADQVAGGSIPTGLADTGGSNVLTLWLWLASVVMLTLGLMLVARRNMGQSAEN